MTNFHTAAIFFDSLRSLKVIFHIQITKKKVAMKSKSSRSGPNDQVWGSLGLVRPERCEADTPIKCSAATTSPDALTTKPPQ